MSIEMIMSTPEHIIVEYALCDVPITRGTFTWDKYRGTLFIDKEGYRWGRQIPQLWDKSEIIFKPIY